MSETLSIKVSSAALSAAADEAAETESTEG